MKKMTYVEAINSVLEGIVNEEVIERMKALKAQLEKRNGSERKPTKTQKENTVLAEDIWAYVSENGAKRANEVAIYFGITGQKASALLNALAKKERLEKVTDKRVTFFRVAEGM